MPESGDSGQNGRRIRSFNSRSNKPRSSPLSPASTSNCHSPFKQSQAERTNCGRGYSERGIIIHVPPRKVFLLQFCHELLTSASGRGNTPVLWNETFEKPSPHYPVLKPLTQHTSK